MIVWHGCDEKTAKLILLHGLPVGMYVGTLEVAKTYGPVQVQIQVPVEWLTVDLEYCWEPEHIPISWEVLRAIPPAMCQINLSR